MMLDGDTAMEFDVFGDTVVFAVEHESLVELGFEKHCVAQTGHVVPFACLLLLHHYHVH